MYFCSGVGSTSRLTILRIRRRRWLIQIVSALRVFIELVDAVSPMNQQFIHPDTVFQTLHHRFSHLAVRQPAHHRHALSTTTRTPSMCRIIDNPHANESGSSIPLGLTLSRKRPAPPNRTAIPEKPRRSGPKRNPSPASERIIVSAAPPLTCALARWGFRFARLLSRVNARPFRFVTLLRVTASVFWQNGMEVRLSLITASRSTRAPTIHPSTTTRTLTMCRIIDSPRANDLPHCQQPAR